MSIAETLWSLLRALVIAALVIILLVRLFEERFIFFPDAIVSDPELIAANRQRLEDVFLTSADGVRIHAWWSPAQAPEPASAFAFVYFHGNAGNLSDRVENILWLRELPANVLAVDYRGYGQSQGRPTEAGVYLDAEAAYDWLAHERRIPPQRIVGLGQSLGAAVAVELAARRPLAGLVLEAGFPSGRRVSSRVMVLPGIHWFIRSRFDSAARLQELTIPVFIAHCRRDPVMPFVMGEELYAAARQPKTFVAYDAACHEPLWVADPDDYARRLRTFLALLEKK